MCPPLLLGLQYLAHPGAFVTLATLGYVAVLLTWADLTNLVLSARG